MRFGITCTLIIFLIPQLAESQWRLSPQDTFSEAFEFMNYGEYDEALPLFSSLSRDNEDNYYLHYLTGLCHINMEGQKTRALQHFEKASEKISLDHHEGSFDEKSAPVECLYYLGIAYRMAYHFDESILSFNRMIEILEERYDMQKIEREIEITEKARELYNGRQHPEIITNNDLPDIDQLHKNIVISGDESVVVFIETRRFYDAVMFTQRTEQGWTRPSNITGQLGSDGLAYPVFLSNDGMQLYLYQHDPISGTNIYISDRLNGLWSTMVKLNENINSIGTEHSASLTENSNKIYFSSNRIPGEGGFDIFISERNKDGEWGQAENLGPPVNTRLDDSYPNISPDGKTLFFSSRGHNGSGGYDLFVSHKNDNGEWSSPINLGFPINTPQDDILLLPVDDGSTAYINLRDEENTDIKEFTKIKIDKFIKESAADTINNDTIPEVHSTADTIINDTIPEHHSAADTVILDMKPVFFGFDDYHPTDSSLFYISETARLLNYCEDIKVELRGYTDALGPPEYNKYLAGLRAGAVADTLIKLGVGLERIIINPIGMDNYIARNRTAEGTDNIEGRKYNRRVDFIFIDLPPNIKISNILVIPDHLKNN
jgi:outer membrane protein OmpA-like peptidoglycan-associated protein